ncbi:unnamed protein product [Brachionus calyciflorus]|uniref:Tetratricopeptide repeat protein 5 OB fold domain-containing protein n=1 Tax=Brachionus calyciflorus TaxID=104777 RepID=A0A813NKG4_9BILA|nr:unnamed protein product [Brachionus calyciflorus]
MSDKPDKKILFEKFNKKIDDLYTFRDKYFILNESCTNPEDRLRELNIKLDSLIGEIESETENFESKAIYLVLLGKAYNVTPDFSQKSFDSLTKCLKLDPKLVDGWNYLGECYWKKRDFKMCKNCFEQSLKLNKNKLALRGLSMVIRQLITSEPKNTKNLIDESIRLAKESLQFDFKDGMSWYILANCYVSLFFSPFGQQNVTILKQAISAFNQALKDESVAQLQSDLYYNKSMISMYEENWSDVLNCLSKALNLDPFWHEVKDNLKGCLKFLSNIQEMIKTKGKLKSKKFQSLIDEIQKSDLGPYVGSYQTEKEKIELSQCNLKDLKPGLNTNKVLVGKVICTLQPKTTDAENLNIICFTCCIADSNGDCAALTIYNLAIGDGVIIGNSIAIPEPWLERVDFKFNLRENLKNQTILNEISDNMDFEFKFDSIRVENPSVLVVKGKKWGKDKVSSAFFVPKVVQD